MTGPDGWASAVPSGTPDEALVPFDASRPNIARAYDYLLGGKDHFPADRHLAERLLAIYPGVRQMVKENRRSLIRALDYALAQNITQYVDLGAGLPTSPAVHNVVRSHASTAGVVYVTERLLTAFDIKAIYNRDKHQVTIHATITDATPQAVLNLFGDPRADHNRQLAPQPESAPAPKIMLPI